MVSQNLKRSSKGHGKWNLKSSLEYESCVAFNPWSLSCHVILTYLQLNEDWNIDAPSYKFTKLDVENPEHKKIINEYLLMEGDFGGKTFNQGKVFK